MLTQTVLRKALQCQLIVVRILWRGCFVEEEKLESDWVLLSE